MMISETLKWLLDQALEYPALKEQLAKAENDDDVQKILDRHGIHLSSQQIPNIKEYINTKLDI